MDVLKALMGDWLSTWKVQDLTEKHKADASRSPINTHAADVRERAPA
jgi:hypothetical protein